VSQLSRATTYDWRARGMRAGRPGSWTSGAFTTTDYAARWYCVKDHLGSIRAVVNPDALGSGTSCSAGHRVGDGDARRRCRQLLALRTQGRNVTTGTLAVKDDTGHELDREASSLAGQTGMHDAGAPQGHFLASL